MNSQKERMLGILGAVGASLLWSTGGVLIKLVNWSPLPIAGIRSLIAALLILLYLKSSRRAGSAKPEFTFSWPQVIASVSMAGTLLLFVAANKLTTAANAILLQYTAPIYVALFSSLFLKEKVRRWDWAVIAVVLIGLSLFFFDRMAAGNLLGNLLALLSGLTFAAMIIALRYQKDGSPMESTFLGNVLTFVVTIPFIATAPMLDATSVVGLVLLGVFQLGLAYVLFTNAMKRITAVEGVLVNVVEPLFNPVWVFLFLGETPSVNALAGGVIVITAITLRSLLSARREKAQESLKA